MSKENLVFVIVAEQAYIRNIDEKIKLERDLQYRSSHDALTDTYNRGYFEKMIDYYNKELLINEDRVEDEITEDMEKELKEEVCNHSDLFWFLNFTDMDVFYQKSNIKRSFLRLLFYDSTDASTQSLLYQAVVWLDGKKLYKTYIDNIKEKKYYNIGVIVSERYFDQTYSFYWLMYQELATKALNKNCFIIDI